MKFRIKQNVLPKNIKLIQKYLDETSEESYDSSYESSYESSYYSDDSSNEYTTSEGSSNNESDDGSEYSFESESTAARNFGDFLKEYSKVRDYKVTINPTIVDYFFDSKKVGGKWKRHIDKSVNFKAFYLNTDKESLRNGDPKYIKIYPF